MYPIIDKNEISKKCVKYGNNHRYKKYQYNKRQIIKIQNYYRLYKTSKIHQKELQRSIKIKKELQMEIQREFVENFNLLKNKKQVQIHIPSFTNIEYIRKNINNMQLLENEQINRIFLLKDPNVTIMYKIK